MILMGDFITDMIFQEEMEDRIITREEFMKRYEDTVGKSVDLLAQEMEIDPEYASLVVPTMVVCRNFIDIFNAESLWAPGVSLLDGIAYDFAEKKKNFSKVSTILKMTFWLHQRTLQNAIPAVRAISREL